MYYNTTNVSGDLLLEFEDKAQTQEQAILNEFKKHPEYSPADLFYLFIGKYPITSIRRSLTNLTNEGKLIKTGFKRKGLFGRMEYVWKLKD
jgi:hypothetical protein